MRGLVTRLVRGHGSTWGYVAPHATARNIFFNAASLALPEGFASLHEGQEVEFEVVADAVNETRAVHIAFIAS